MVRELNPMFAGVIPTFVSWNHGRDLRHHFPCWGSRSIDVGKDRETKLICPARCFDGDAAAKPPEIKLHSQFQEFDGFAASVYESLQLFDLFFQGTAFKDKQRWWRGVALWTDLRTPTSTKTPKARLEYWAVGKTGNSGTKQDLLTEALCQYEVCMSHQVTS